MKMLRVLGWLFIPYILIFFRWKKLNTFSKTVFICWSVLLLSIMINSSSKQDSMPSASAQGQPDTKTTQTHTTTKPVASASSRASKPVLKQPSQAQVAAQQKAQLDAEIQKAKNGSAQEKEQALKDYINIDKSDLLAKNPTVRDMGFAGDLFIQTNKNTVKEYTSVGDQLINQQANGVYWEVEVTLNNDSSSPVDVNTNMFTLVMPDGRQFATDIKAEMMISKAIITDTLNPGVDDTGYLIFDMPKGSIITDAMLNVQNGFNNAKLKIS